jgi:hypothetical protein
MCGRLRDSSIERSEEADNISNQTTNDPYTRSPEVPLLTLL